MTWKAATPDEILADLRTIAESQPPVYDASRGTWLRWAVGPGGRVALAAHRGSRSGDR